MSIRKVASGSCRSKFKSITRPANRGQGTGERRAGGRIALLAAERDFRVFYTGYATSLLGTAMSRIALTFAVLDSGGTAADLGIVFAASVFPQVLVMLGGGVLADRTGRRPVMLVTDTTRLVVQGSLAAILFTGKPALLIFAVMAALLSVAEGFFYPALGGLRAEIMPASKLPEANALVSVAQSAAAIGGPALAGLLVATTSPAVVVAIDAATYGASVVSLAMLRVPQVAPPGQSPWRDLADAITMFRSQTWLWLTTAQFALFNLLAWAPYLLLGPILATRYLGGAGAWGAVTAAFAFGSVLAGLAMAGRRPRRPLVVAVIGTFGFALPCLMLAVRASVFLVAGGALLAGVGSTVNGTLSASVQQQLVPPRMLARISAITLTGSYALGSAGWVLIGPLAELLGPRPLLTFAAAWCAVSSAVLVALPAIRSVTWQPRDADAG